MDTREYEYLMLVHHCILSPIVDAQKGTPSIQINLFLKLPCNAAHPYFSGKSCGRPEDKDGLKMVSLPFPGANDFEFETSVEYSCSRLHHVIVGHPEQKCGLTEDEKGVEWHGELPDCVGM